SLPPPRLTPTAKYVLPHPGGADPVSARLAPKVPRHPERSKGSLPLLALRARPEDPTRSVSAYMPPHRAPMLLPVRDDLRRLHTLGPARVRRNVVPCRRNSRPRACRMGSPSRRQQFKAARFLYTWPTWQPWTSAPHAKTPGFPSIRKPGAL